MADPVAGQLEKARESLLDLSLHNRMLNYRPTRRTSIRVVDEQLAHVWRLLVEKENQLEFLSRDEHEHYDAKSDSFPEAGDTDEEDDEAIDLPLPPQEPLERTADQPAKRHSDRCLQTSLEGESLQTSLLRLFQESNSAREELGINVLFLAMGFLHWRPLNREDTVAAPLFLVPVELERSSAKRRFKLKSLGDSPIFNPCIARKLELDFHVKMPAEPAEWEGFDLPDYLRRLETEISGQKNWRVGDDLFLGLFSFNKYLMYLDLDAATWPESCALIENPLLRAMCGDRESLAAAPTSPAARDLDRTLDPASVFQVLDADSSQQAAIAAAKAGANLVIQGPPGTGKSQSITNIISECLAAGKSVLFVSQKLAALEVVKSRLENVGLGDFCLELHSTKAARSAVLAELQRVLSTVPPAPAEYEREADRLRQTRQALNDYVHALHEPAGPASITPFQAMGKVAVLDALPQVACEMPGFHEWDRAQLQRMTDLIHSLKRQLQNIGDPTAHAFRGAGITLFTQQIRAAAGELFTQLAAHTKTCLTRHAALAATLHSQAPATPAQMRRLVESANILLASPSIEADLLSDSRWETTRPEAQKLIELVTNYEHTRAAVNTHYDIPLAEQVLWIPMRDRAKRKWQSIFRWFRPSYWRDRACLKLHARGIWTRTIHEMISDVEIIAKFGELRAQIVSQNDAGQHFFGGAWRVKEISSEELTSLSNWLPRMRKLLREGFSKEILPLCAAGADRTILAAQCNDLAAACEAWHNTWTKLEQLLRIDPEKMFESAALDTSLEQWTIRLARMAAEIDTLDGWAQYQDVIQPCEQSPLASFVAQAEKQQVEPVWLPGAFEKQFHTLWIDRFFALRDSLRQFAAVRHEDLVDEFARLDAQWLEQSRHRLYAKLAESRPATGFEAAKSAPLGILQSEVRRKRGGRSLRRLFKDAGEAVLRTKPCFMMSPLSVAQYLAPDGIRFDVVVFDEASQVEPADALGAIARGKQLILVGDSKQLPPTSFFSNLSGDAAEPNEGEAGLADMESILDRGESVLTTLSLRWHYRSKHESLISFSNHEFYNNELVVFPSCHTGRGEMGVTLEHDPEHFYDRGKSRSNRQQAARVAAAVFDHYRKHPEKSLGVATFSVAQRQAVLDEVEKLRRKDDSFEAFFDPARPEHFFVKNLETIQGDERDVIFMSVGHGRSIAGERVGAAISNLTDETGWRRLNVLITRARERYVVFTSILGQEIDVSGTQARGVHSFKRYLEYAQSGRLSAAISRDGEFGSDFEKAVYNALQEQGITLHRQVGCAGYSIDLCVVDPAMPGRYILGIECDGATYHGSATARDRDRLRQQVLEGLGWRIHRVWSTDWYRRPKAELQRVIDAITKARTGQLPARFRGLSDRVRTKVATSVVPLDAASAEEKSAIPTVPYRMFAMESVRPPENFYTDSIDQLAALLVSIVDIEGPIHMSQAMRRAAGQYGLERIGEKMQMRIMNAAQRGISSGALALRDDFFWPSAMNEPPIRSRADDANREVEYICVEEIGLAAERLVAVQFGMTEVDLASHTARTLGFRVVSSKVRAHIANAIQQQIARGRLVVDANGLIKAAK